MATRTKRVGLREYARRRGCSPASVSRAIAEQRLLESIRRDSKGHPRIDPELADMEWGANTDPGKRPPRSEKEGTKASEETPTQRPRVSRVSLNEEGDELPPFEESRARREAYAAKLKKLEFEELDGKLLRKKDVQKATFEISRTIRDSLLLLPHRLGPILAAESDTFTVQIRMEAEIRETLENLGRLIDKLYLDEDTLDGLEIDGNRSRRASRGV